MALTSLSQPSCVADPGSLCARVWNLTKFDWFATHADVVLGKTLSVALIVVITLVLRAMVKRLINRLTRTSHRGRIPALLRPLRERAPEALVASASAIAGPLLSERRAQRAQTIGSVLRSLSSATILGIGFMLVLGELGINLAPILASAGIAGVAIGFGAQNLVKDFLSGMFMMLEDQYGVGDVVDLGEAGGVVESVGLRVTTLRDVNGTVWYVRNGEVQRVGNKSQGYAVAVVDLPLAHTVDTHWAGEIAAEAATAATTSAPLSADVLAPPEVLGVETVTTESVTLRLTVKVRAGRQFVVRRALYAKIKAAFDAAHVAAPFPPNWSPQPPYPTAPAAGHDTNGTHLPAPAQTGPAQAGPAQDANTEDAAAQGAVAGVAIAQADPAVAGAGDPAGGGEPGSGTAPPAGPGTV